MDIVRADATALSRAFPMCPAPFPPESESDDAYTLHVAGCTMSSSSASSAVSPSQTESVDGIARATTTTTSTTSAPTTVSPEAPGSGDMDMEAAAPPKVALFPSQCALCGSGGPSLLPCSGSCARVFHAACIDDVQPDSSSSSTVAGTSAQSHNQWTCAECARGVHYAVEMEVATADEKMLDNAKDSSSALSSSADVNLSSDTMLGEPSSAAQPTKSVSADAPADTVSSAEPPGGAVEAIENAETEMEKKTEESVVREAAEAPTQAFIAPQQAPREQQSFVAADEPSDTKSVSKESNAEIAEPGVEDNEPAVVANAPVEMEVNDVAARQQENGVVGVGSKKSGEFMPVAEQDPIPADADERRESTSDAAALTDLKKTEAVLVSKTRLEATFVDAVDVSIALQAGSERSKGIANKQKGDRESESQAAKRQKLSHETTPQQQQQQSQKGGLKLVKVPPPFEFSTSTPTSINPLPPSSNTFAREKESYTATQVAMKHNPQTRKQRVLAEYSPQMLQELEHHAAVFLEEETNPLPHSRRRKSSNPKHCDAFPFATAPESFRPPFFRPSVVFSRSRGRRMEGLSRILLSQDKRNIKCFIQGTDENRCVHQPSIANDGGGGAAAGSLGSHMTARSEGSFVTIDLMSVDSFKALEMVIRTRMIAAVEQNDGYLQEIFEDRADCARRLFAEKKNSGLAMDLYYCSYDGSREKVARETDDWLCFCANVCHLTAVIPLQADREVVDDGAAADQRG